jgi:putative IMPACT (imprinted ancient) family translation regulator
VVTRYFGGVKLGKGGLQRAYSGGVQKALESLPTARRVHRSTVWVAVEYAERDPLVRAVTELDAVLVGEEYGADVRLKMAVPSERLEEFRHAVAAVTGGRGLIEPAD